MGFSNRQPAESRLPELITALGLGAVLALVAYREGQRQGRLRETWMTSPVKMCLPDGTWVDAENLADAGRIMRTLDELAELPEADMDQDASLDAELD